MPSNSNINSFSRLDMLVTREANLGLECKVWLKIILRIRWLEGNLNLTAIWKSFLRTCTRTPSSGWISRWWTHNEIWAIFKWDRNRIAIIMHSKSSMNSWWASTRVVRSQGVLQPQLKTGCSAPISTLYSKISPILSKNMPLPIKKAAQLNFKRTKLR